MGKIISEMCVVCFSFVVVQTVTETEAISLYVKLPDLVLLELQLMIISD